MALKGDVTISLELEKAINSQLKEVTENVEQMEDAVVKAEGAMTKSFRWMRSEFGDFGEALVSNTRIITTAFSSFALVSKFLGVVNLNEEMTKLSVRMGGAAGSARQLTDTIHDTSLALGESMDNITQLVVALAEAGVKSKDMRVLATNISMMADVTGVAETQIAELNGRLNRIGISSKQIVKLNDDIVKVGTAFGMSATTMGELLNVTTDVVEQLKVMGTKGKALEKSNKTIGQMGALFRTAGLEVGKVGEIMKNALDPANFADTMKMWSQMGYSANDLIGTLQAGKGVPEDFAGKMLDLSGKVEEMAKNNVFAADQFAKDMTGGQLSLQEFRKLADPAVSERFRKSMAKGMGIKEAFAAANDSVGSSWGRLIERLKTIVSKLMETMLPILEKLDIGKIAEFLSKGVMGIGSMITKYAKPIGILLVTTLGLFIANAVRKFIFGGKRAGEAMASAFIAGTKQAATTGGGPKASTMPKQDAMLSYVQSQKQFELNKIAGIDSTKISEKQERSLNKIISLNGSASEQYLKQQELLEKNRQKLDMVAAAEKAIGEDRKKLLADLKITATTEAEIKKELDKQVEQIAIEEKLINDINKQIIKEAKGIVDTNKLATRTVDIAKAQEDIERSKYNLLHNQKNMTKAQKKEQRDILNDAEKHLATMKQENKLLDQQIAKQGKVADKMSFFGGLLQSAKDKMAGMVPDKMKQAGASIKTRGFGQSMLLAKDMAVDKVKEGGKSLAKGALKSGGEGLKIAGLGGLVKILSIVATILMASAPVQKLLNDVMAMVGDVLKQLEPVLQVVGMVLKDVVKLLLDILGPLLNDLVKLLLPLVVKILGLLLIILGGLLFAIGHLIKALTFGFGDIGENIIKGSKNMMEGGVKLLTTPMSELSANADKQAKSVDANTATQKKEAAKPKYEVKDGTAKRQTEKQAKAAEDAKKYAARSVQEQEKTNQHLEKIAKNA
jgi:hypothetical protein